VPAIAVPLSKDVFKLSRSTVNHLECCAQHREQCEANALAVCAVLATAKLANHYIDMEEAIGMKRTRKEQGKTHVRTFSLHAGKRAGQLAIYGIWELYGSYMGSLYGKLLASFRYSSCRISLLLLCPATAPYRHSSNRELSYVTACCNCCSLQLRQAERPCQPQWQWQRHPWGLPGA